MQFRPAFALGLRAVSIRSAPAKKADIKNASNALFS